MPIQSGRLSPPEYAENFSDIHPPLTASKAGIEANRCINCFDAPCTKACPTSIDVPLFIKQIATGNIKGSAKTIFESNIFGGGCARVCPTEKLCEGACVCNFLHEEPIPIGQLQRFSTDQAIKGKWPLFKQGAPTGKRVAVVGAGPAGLSCAHRLAREGVEVTIFEKEKKAGGLMTYGVAAYKVSPEFCKDEVDFIMSVGGIKIEYGKALGTDVTVDDLKKKYDAVFLGIGLGNTRALEIPGENLAGVEDAISFIYKIRTNEYDKVPVGDRVAVIGMGMTAIDAATQSKRLGAKEVTMVYRRTEAEKPCTEKEFDLAKLDQCRQVWLAAPSEILGENGKVKALVCEKMTLGAPDASGRKSPVPTGEKFSIEVDMVIKATGQLPFDKIVGSEIKTDKGKIQVNNRYETSMKGVFAGGDCFNGGKEVVDAVEHGKIAAQSILKDLGISKN